MTITRKGFLQGMGFTAAGAALGAVGQHQLTPKPLPIPPPKLVPSRIPPRGEDSFAQSGEDRIAGFMLQYLGVRPIDYLDVGAYHPVEINNTYLFYRMGYRGVLVEPNVTMCERLREVRPEDKVLEAGIGVTAAREADYYLMTEPAWNTFSREEAEHSVEVSKGSISIRQVVKMPLLDINQVMADHFPVAPAFLSIDAEGLHLAILKSIDYARFRPKVICAETLVSGTRQTIPETAAFMETQDYVVRGMTFVNTIFVDSRII